MLITGKCHCGNISFVLDWKPEPTEIPARADGCTFCAKHGGVWTSCPTGSLRVTVQQPALRSRYRFATKTADFHVCALCGVVPVVTSEIDGRLYALVNVNALEGLAPSLLGPVVSRSLDGEGTDDRLARRKRNWIPDVAFAPTVTSRTSGCS
jgi:hypothetical protein